MEEPFGAHLYHARQMEAIFLMPTMQSVSLVSSLKSVPYAILFTTMLECRAHALDTSISYDPISSRCTKLRLALVPLPPFPLFQNLNTDISSCFFYIVSD